MDRITLEMPFFQNSDKDNGKFGPRVERNGVAWYLYGTKMHWNFEELKHVMLQVCWRPVESATVFRCEADIIYKNNRENHPSETLVINHRRSEDSTSSTKFRAEMSWLNLNNQYRAEVVIKALEIVPKYNFEFKDSVLTDISLIVGDKTLFTNKKILAFNSKKFYDMIYGGDKEIDRIEIDENDILKFREIHKFLTILHGFDCGRLSFDKIMKIAELSARYESKRCLDHCEISYLHFPKQVFEDEYWNEHPLFQKEKAYMRKVRWQTRRMYSQGAKSDESIPMTKLDLDGTDTPIFLDIDGIPFKIICKHYGAKVWMYIHCLHQDGVDLWECEVLMTITGARPKTRKFIVKPKEAKVVTISWSPKDQVSMGIKNFCNPYPEDNVDFSEARENRTDVVLSVGDKKYHILATASPYFYSLFYANFTEKGKDEVELMEVDAAEFEEFLQHVYYPRRFVKESTLESLLHLSNYYDVELIRSNCIRWILFDMRATNAQKMVLAVKYNLEDLFKNLAARIETVEDFTAFSKLDGFDELDATTIARIKPKEENCLKRKLDTGPSDT